MSDSLQTIPARHGTATFVPSGHTIKIINTFGTQVVDTWAFALPSPPQQNLYKLTGEVEADGKAKPAQRQEPSKEQEPVKEQESSKETEISKEQENQKGQSSEEATTNPEPADAKAAEEPKPQGWSSYIPTLGLSSGKKTVEPAPSDEKASQGWSSYFPSGQGYTSYLPSKGMLSAFATSHYRDPDKPYAEQLTDFARTPVGAAGLSAATGSGPAGSIYAAYSAFDAQGSPPVAPMEYMSMPHCRAHNQRLVPKLNDTFVSNLREPLLTLIEDNSPGIHDTLMAACDPQRYKGLGVEKWEEHGSCSENLVLALKELNEKAGLKGAQAVGADIIVEKVPAPLNLFMNIPWNRDGKLRFEGPAGDKGDSVTLRAERDVIVVMSACPQDILSINGGQPTDAHFLVEGPESKQATEESESKKSTEEPEPKKPEDLVEEGGEKQS